MISFIKASIGAFVLIIVNSEPNIDDDKCQCEKPLDVDAFGIVGFRLTFNAGLTFFLLLALTIFLCFMGLIHLYELIKIFTHLCHCSLCKNQFKVGEQLGAGGYGVVWRVTRNSDTANLVMKKVPIEDLTEGDSYSQEARQLVSLRHRNIVSYESDFIHRESRLGTLKTNLSFFIVMEFCDRGDIKDLIDKVRERHDWVKKLSIAIQKAPKNHPTFKPILTLSQQLFNRIRQSHTAPFGLVENVQPNPQISQGQLPSSVRKRRKSRRNNLQASPPRHHKGSNDGQHHAIDPNCVNEVDLFFQEGLPTVPRVPEHVSLAILHACLQAVNYLHSQDIVHRDLKSQNVFLDSAGRAKIGDFGLSCRTKTTPPLNKNNDKQKEQKNVLSNTFSGILKQKNNTIPGEKSRLDSFTTNFRQIFKSASEFTSRPTCNNSPPHAHASTSSPTAVLTCAGTEFYMSPEMLAQVSVDGKAADMFSLGLVFWELLTGEFVWSYLPTEPGRMDKEEFTNYIIHSLETAEVTIWVRELVLRMLDWTPERRPSASTILKSNRMKLIGRVNEAIVSSYTNELWEDCSRSLERIQTLIHTLKKISKADLHACESNKRKQMLHSSTSLVDSVLLDEPIEEEEEDGDDGALSNSDEEEKVAESSLSSDDDESTNFNSSDNVKNSDEIEDDDKLTNNKQPDEDSTVEYTVSSYDHHGPHKNDLWQVNGLATSPFSPTSSLPLSASEEEEKAFLARRDIDYQLMLLGWDANPHSVQLQKSNNQNHSRYSSKYSAIIENSPFISASSLTDSPPHSASSPSLDPNLDTQVSATSSTHLFNIKARNRSRKFSSSSSKRIAIINTSGLQINPETEVISKPQSVLPSPTKNCQTLLVDEFEYPKVDSKLVQRSVPRLQRRHSSFTYSSNIPDIANDVCQNNAIQLNSKSTWNESSSLSSSLQSPVFQLKRSKTQGLNEIDNASSCDESAGKSFLIRTTKPPSLPLFSTHNKPSLSPLTTLPNIRPFFEPAKRNGRSSMARALLPLFAGGDGVAIMTSEGHRANPRDGDAPSAALRDVMAIVKEGESVIAEGDGGSTHQILTPRTPIEELISPKSLRKHSTTFSCHPSTPSDSEENEEAHCDFGKFQLNYHFGLTTTSHTRSNSIKVPDNKNEKNTKLDNEDENKSEAGAVVILDGED